MKLTRQKSAVLSSGFYWHELWGITIISIRLGKPDTSNKVLFFLSKKKRKKKLYIKISINRIWRPEEEEKHESLPTIILIYFCFQKKYENFLGTKRIDRKWNKLSPLGGAKLSEVALAK